MFKKYTALFLILALTLTLPALCAAEAAENVPEIPVFEWERDANEHWHVLESGEKVDAEAHAMEDILCTVCGSEIWIFDDGSTDISNYNEYGDLVHATSYDVDGTILYDTMFAYAYDEAGNMLWEKVFDNGVYFGETTYALNAEGENHPVKSVSYYDDGTWAVNEYDDHGNLVKAFTYEADGTVSYEGTYEYALSADGWYYEVKSVSRMDQTVFIDEYNEYGDRIRSYISEDDGTVVFDITYEYEYNEGVMVWRKQYDAGRLSMESFCNEWGDVVKEIEYLEDGTTYVAEYDENGDLIE